MSGRWRVLGGPHCGATFDFKGDCMFVVTRYDKLSKKRVSKDMVSAVPLSLAADPEVSSVHCRIVLTSSAGPGNGFHDDRPRMIVHDLGSTNGTFVLKPETEGGVVAPSAAQLDATISPTWESLPRQCDVELPIGCALRFGQSCLVLELSAASVSATAAPSAAAVASASAGRAAATVMATCGSSIPAVDQAAVPKSGLSDIRASSGRLCKEEQPKEEAHIAHKAPGERKELSAAHCPGPVSALVACDKPDGYTVARHGKEAEERTTDAQVHRIHGQTASTDAQSAAGDAGAVSSNASEAALPHASRGAGGAPRSDTIDTSNSHTPLLDAAACPLKLLNTTALPVGQSRGKGTGEAPASGACDLGTCCACLHAPTKSSVHASGAPPRDAEMAVERQHPCGFAALLCPQAAAASWPRGDGAGTAGSSTASDSVDDKLVKMPLPALMRLQAAAAAHMSHLSRVCDAIQAAVAAASADQRVTRVAELASSSHAAAPDASAKSAAARTACPVADAPMPPANAKPASAASLASFARGAASEPVAGADVAASGVGTASSRSRAASSNGSSAARVSHDASRGGSDSDSDSEIQILEAPVVPAAALRGKHGAETSRAKRGAARGGKSTEKTAALAGNSASGAASGSGSGRSQSQQRRDTKAAASAATSGRTSGDVASVIAAARVAAAAADDSIDFVDDDAEGEGDDAGVAISARRATEGDARANGAGRTIPLDEVNGDEDRRLKGDQDGDDNGTGGPASLTGFKRSRGGAAAGKRFSSSRPAGAAAMRTDGADSEAEAEGAAEVEAEAQAGESGKRTSASQLKSVKAAPGLLKLRGKARQEAQAALHQLSQAVAGAVTFERGGELILAEAAAKRQRKRSAPHAQHGEDEQGPRGGGDGIGVTDGVAAVAGKDLRGLASVSAAAVAAAAPVPLGAIIGASSGAGAVPVVTSAAVGGPVVDTASLAACEAMRLLFPSPVPSRIASTAAKATAASDGSGDGDADAAAPAPAAVSISKGRKAGLWPVAAGVTSAVAARSAAVDADADADILPCPFSQSAFDAGILPGSRSAATAAPPQSRQAHIAANSSSGLHRGPQAIVAGGQQPKLERPALSAPGLEATSADAQDSETEPESDSHSDCAAASTSQSGGHDAGVEAGMKTGQSRAVDTAHVTDAQRSLPRKQSESPAAAAGAVATARHGMIGSPVTHSSSPAEVPSAVLEGPAAVAVASQGRQVGKREATSAAGESEENANGDDGADQHHHDAALRHESQSSSDASEQLRTSALQPSHAYAHPPETSSGPGALHREAPAVVEPKFSSMIAWHRGAAVALRERLLAAFDPELKPQLEVDDDAGDDAGSSSGGGSNATRSTRDSCRARAAATRDILDHLQCLYAAEYVALRMGVEQEEMQQPATVSHTLHDSEPQAGSESLSAVDEAIASGRTPPWAEEVAFAFSFGPDSLAPATEGMREELESVRLQAKALANPRVAMRDGLQQLAVRQGEVLPMPMPEAVLAPMLSAAGASASSAGVGVGITSIGIGSHSSRRHVSRTTPVEPAHAVAAAAANLLQQAFALHTFASLSARMFVAYELDSNSAASHGSELPAASASTGVGAGPSRTASKSRDHAAYRFSKQKWLRLWQVGDWLLSDNDETAQLMKPSPMTSGRPLASPPQPATAQTQSQERESARRGLGAAAQSSSSRGSSGSKDVASMAEAAQSSSSRGSSGSKDVASMAESTSGATSGAVHPRHDDECPAHEDVVSSMPEAGTAAAAGVPPSYAAMTTQDLRLLMQSYGLRVTRQRLDLRLAADKAAGLRGAGNGTQAEAAVVEEPFSREEMCATLLTLWTEGHQPLLSPPTTLGLSAAALARLRRAGVPLQAQSELELDHGHAELESKPARLTAHDGDAAMMVMKVPIVTNPVSAAGVRASGEGLDLADIVLATQQVVEEPQLADADVDVDVDVDAGTREQPPALERALRKPSIPKRKVAAPTKAAAPASSSRGAAGAAGKGSGAAAHAEAGAPASGGSGDESVAEPLWGRGCALPVREQVVCFIRAHPALHAAAVGLETLDGGDLHERLREAGVRVSLEALREVLRELGLSVATRWR